MQPDKQSSTTGPTEKDKRINWLNSILLNLAILGFPIVVSIVFYNEGITTRSLIMTVAMFLISVILSTTQMFKIIFGFIVAGLLVNYGRIPETEKVVNILYNWYAMITVFAIVVLIFDKYDLHVRKGEPFK